MKNKKLAGTLAVVFLLGFFLTSWHCAKKEVSKDDRLAVLNGRNFANDSMPSFDSIRVESFYAKYPKLQLYKEETEIFYKKNHYTHIWYDKKGKKEIASVIYNKINNLVQEGVQTTVPYKELFDELFQKEDVNPNVETELFLTNYYFFYTHKVIQGIDYAKSEELEWYLPRKQLSYSAYLDSLLLDPQLIDKKEHLNEQYYKLKIILQKYRDIEKSGGWKAITTAEGFKELKPGDSIETIAQIRTRLFLTDDIDSDNQSAVYDKTLQKAVLKFKKRNGFTIDKVILPKHIQEMNVAVNDRIKTILVNMERCRWISKDITKNKEFIVVNIPSYRLSYFKEGKTVLVSNVVVGSALNKTVIFSGIMNTIVFSPYWNVPKSIIDKEIKPAMAKNKNYLSQHNMEWNNGNIRQKPGSKNSLGLVKFLFPNSNNIYLHDSPSKSLFNQDKRAFSHGCIRVAKPKELANLILENDPYWTPKKIEEAMNGGKEKWCILKQKIPVYIGYFTAWVDEEGTINFYKDVYERDASLAAVLLED